MNIVQHSNENIDAICLPFDRQPVREYWCLREKRFFRWAILPLSKYVTKLLAVWISTLLLALFVRALRSPYRALSYSDISLGAVIADCTVFLCLIRLRAAWYYIYSRLIYREIDYKNLATKETEVCRKSELVLARDRLIARFQVRPILKRIERSMMLLAVIIGSNFLILFVTTNY